MGEPKSREKPFSISKWLVWEAYQRVKANQGAPGVDGRSIEDFEADLGNNLYQVWNRMSSGSYFPPPVLNARDFRYFRLFGVLWSSCPVSVLVPVFPVALAVSGHGGCPRVAAGLARGSTVRVPGGRAVPPS